MIELTAQSYVFAALGLAFGLLVGWLVWQLGGARRVVGALTAVAGLGYLIDAVGTFLVPNYSLNVAMLTFIGELVLMAWLLLQARTPSR